MKHSVTINENWLYDSFSYLKFLLKNFAAINLWRKKKKITYIIWTTPATIFHCTHTVTLQSTAKALEWEIYTEATINTWLHWSYLKCEWLLEETDF